MSDGRDIECLAQTFEYRLRPGGDRHPLAVARAKRIARRNDRQSASGALLHETELVVIEHMWPEHREEGFVDRQIDHLAAPGAIALA